MGEPRVFAIVPVKNYADVIDEVLTAASRWVTRVFVLDNGSDDGSVDVVRAAADRLPNVEFLGVDERPWSYAYYARIYQRAKSIARPGDWWYRLDADEIAVGDPREVLATVDGRFDTVIGSFFCYYFTPSDLAAYEADPDDWLRRPLVDRIRWYRNDWAEPRFVRHRRLMRWKHEGWRDGSFAVAPEMVQIRHYRYRSPDQISGRLGLRSDKDEWAYEQGDYQKQFSRSIFRPLQDGAPAWHRMLADESMLDYDDGRPLRPRPELLPSPPRTHGAIRRGTDRVLASTPAYRQLLRLRDRLS